MGKKDAKGGGDSRFAAVHSDPRFQRFPRAKAKVEIDERFEGAPAGPSWPCPVLWHERRDQCLLHATALGAGVRA